MQKIHILIPALDDTGPIKGAIALANGLSDYYKVIIVVIKAGSNSDSAKIMNQDIEVVSLSSYSGFWRKYTLKGMAMGWQIYM